MSHELEAMIAEILLDPQVRDTCGVYIKPWMFMKKTYQYLVEGLLDPEMMGRLADKRVIQLYLQSHHHDLAYQDWIVIEGIIDRFSPISDRELPSVINIVSTFIKDRLHQKGIDLYTKGKSLSDSKMMAEAEPYLLEATTFKISLNPFINPNEDGILDKLKERDMPTGGKIIKSSLGLVNSVTLYKGYKNADLIMVCAKTKAGKTQLMLQESAAVAAQGFNVAHLFFGDYTEFSGLCRMMSCITGAPLAEVVEHYNDFKRRCERYLDHVRVAAFPFRSLDTPEVISQLKTLKKHFDFSFCALDYDANIRPLRDEIMYETGASMYGSFKGFGEMHGCAVMIGSQIKPIYNKEEELDESAPNESSRKVHHVDIMIGVGRNPECREIGTITMPAVRFGISGEKTRVRFDDKHSRIQDITPEDYERTLRESKNRKDESFRDSVLEGIRFTDKEMQ